MDNILEYFNLYSEDDSGNFVVFISVEKIINYSDHDFYRKYGIVMLKLKIILNFNEFWDKDFNDFSFFTDF